MKHLLITAFCAILLVSSCKCNDDKQVDETTAGTDTMTTAPAATPAATDTGMNSSTGKNTGNADMSDERFKRLFNLRGYTETQVREYRRLHDEMDWGGVPGFYPEGSTRPLTEEDTKYLTEWGHKVMLNEIYARHGMIFTDDELEEHFNSFGWYRATSGNVQSKLTAQEKENIAFLNSHPAQ